MSIIEDESLSLLLVQLDESLRIVYEILLHLLCPYLQRDDLGRDSICLTVVLYYNIGIELRLNEGLYLM